MVRLVLLLLIVTVSSAMADQFESLFRQMNRGTHSIRRISVDQYCMLDPRADLALAILKSDETSPDWRKFYKDNYCGVLLATHDGSDGLTGLFPKKPEKTCINNGQRRGFLSNRYFR